MTSLKDSDFDLRVYLHTTEKAHVRVTLKLRVLEKGIQRRKRTKR